MYRIGKINIPDTVTVVENSSFSGCTKLEEVKYSNKLTKIENDGFYGCTSLKKLLCQILLILSETVFFKTVQA